jgi:hypothetical protein
LWLHVSTSRSTAKMPAAVKPRFGVDPRAIPFLDAVAELLAARILGELYSVRVSTRPQATPSTSARSSAHKGAAVRPLRDHQGAQLEPLRGP